MEILVLVAVVIVASVLWKGKRRDQGDGQGGGTDPSPPKTTNRTLDDELEK